MSEIIADTNNLYNYADRIDASCTRLKNLDDRIGELYARYGLKGLYRLTSSDGPRSVSKKLKKDSAFLKDTANSLIQIENGLGKFDPLNFTPPADVTGGKGPGGAKGVIKGIMTGGSLLWQLIGPTPIQQKLSVGKAVVKGAKHVFSELLVDYYQKGTTYKVVQYGKAVVKTAKGVVKIVKGVAAVASGVGAPVGILSIISGMNDVYNGIMDGTYVYTEQYDEVGKHNALKDKLAESGGIIGEYLGNKEAGERVGKATYYGVDLVTSFAALEKSFNKLKDLKPIDWGLLKEEARDVGNIDVMTLLKANDETIRYNLELAKHSGGTGNFVKTVGALVGVGKKSVSVGKKINSIITIGCDSKNPVIEAYEKIDGILDKIGKGGKIAVKTTRLLFD